MREIKERTQADIVIIPQKKSTKIKNSSLLFREILFRCLGILLARTLPFPGIAPFGVALLATERKFTPGSLFSYFAVLIGYLSLGDWFSFRYLITASAIMVVLFFAEKPEALSRRVMGACVSGGLLLFGAFSLLWNEVSLSQLFLLVLDPALTFLAFLAFDRCRPLFFIPSFEKHSPTKEEKISFWVLVSLILLSFRNPGSESVFSMANVLGFFLLGTVSLSGGFRAATVAGSILGILLGFRGELLSSLAVFSFCGFICGISSKFGKYTIAGTLSLAGLLLAPYVYGSHAPILRYFEVVMGAGLLILLPDGVFRCLHPYATSVSSAPQQTDFSEKQLRERLALAADSFQALAETFSRIPDRERDADRQEIAALFDLAASHVCRTCPKSKDCWKRDFNGTYQVLFRLLERLERKGVVRKLDVDPYFTERCLNLDGFLTELNRLYEIHKINQVWKQKLRENRLLAGEQFSGVAEILARLGNLPASDVDADNIAVHEIRCRLEKRALRPEEILITRGLDRQISIRFSFRHTIKSDSAIILSVLHQVLGKTFTHVREEQPGTLLFREIPEMAVEAACASSQKEETCGDSHDLNQLQCGKYIAAISDGMGTGVRANRESNTTISLLNAFLSAGFDKTVAVKLLNSVMVMNSASEAFATVDLCMVDLYTGEAEFIKNCAEPSYIKRKTGTETVRSASLPVGVLSGVDVETFAHQLSCGDTVVMVSDGLALKNSGGDWLRHVIDSVPFHITPQDLADEILARAIALKGGQVDDDMTVLVLRLGKVS